MASDNYRAYFAPNFVLLWILFCSISCKFCINILMFPCCLFVYANANFLFPSLFPRQIHFFLNFISFYFILCFVIFYFFSTLFLIALKSSSKFHSKQLYSKTNTNSNRNWLFIWFMIEKFFWALISWHLRSECNRWHFALWTTFDRIWGVTKPLIDFQIPQAIWRFVESPQKQLPVAILST